MKPLKFYSNNASRNAPTLALHARVKTLRLPLSRVNCFVTSKAYLPIIFSANSTIFDFSCA